MRSVIVVTSWWSNCLALTCLHLLAKFAPDRVVYVMQAGKSESQMERFRAFLPSGVSELHYPPDRLADDSAMREYLAFEALGDADGAWFVDHDTFLLSPAESWFSTADRHFGGTDMCLCTATPRHGPGLTQPAYWLSPRRWPPGVSAFHPVPFCPKPYVRRPDLRRQSEVQAIPGKDTLVQAAEELEALGKAGTFPLEQTAGSSHVLPRFPPHRHLGGIHLYTGRYRPFSGGYDSWVHQTVGDFEDFFAGCPKEWLEVEEPELLRRHRGFTAALRNSTDERG